MRINTLAATTAIILALGMGAAHALEAGANTETTTSSGVTIQRGITTTTQNAAGVWSEVQQGSAEAQTSADIATRARGHILPSRSAEATGSAGAETRTGSGLPSSVTGGALSSDVTGGALSSSVTGGALNSTSRTRSPEVESTTDLGVNAEVGTRNQRAGVRAGSSSTGVGLGGNAGVGVGIGR